MPLVTLRYKPNSVPDHLVKALAQSLPGIVASALHVEENPDAHLIPEHVLVDPRPFGRFVVNAGDFDITIGAKWYPGRRQNLDDRRHLIADGVRVLLAEYDANLTGSVFVRLDDGSYEDV